MHHVENNLNEWDLSSTEPYQRDNLLHFIYYYLRFLFAIWGELPFYAWNRNRKRCGSSASSGSSIIESNLSDVLFLSGRLLWLWRLYVFIGLSFCPCTRQILVALSGYLLCLPLLVHSLSVSIIVRMK
jgi:hypothetical protein